MASKLLYSEEIFLDPPVTPLAKLQPANKQFHAFFSHLNFKWKCVNHVGLDGLAQAAFVEDKKTNAANETWAIKTADVVTASYINLLALTIIQTCCFQLLPRPVESHAFSLSDDEMVLCRTKIGPCPLRRNTRVKWRQETTTNVKSRLIIWQPSRLK